MYIGNVILEHTIFTFYDFILFDFELRNQPDCWFALCANTCHLTGCPDVRYLETTIIIYIARKLLLFTLVNRY